MIRAISKCGHVVRWKHHLCHLEAFSHYKFSRLINCDGPKEQDVIARKDILKTPLKDPNSMVMWGDWCITLEKDRWWSWIWYQRWERRVAFFSFLFSFFLLLYPCLYFFPSLSVALLLF